MTSLALIPFLSQRGLFWQGRNVKLVDGFTFTMPDTPVRNHTFNARTENQTESLNVVTTLLDHEKYPANEIGKLYGYRWHVGLDIYPY